ncbi:MAG: hypothetical protein AMJ79_12750 [Phycisphaerae bacterium SM23_30]|nr:MAG: hypothetical protein AMJ79_12750 [Phycisphaerae bacterium SM23_30]
MPSNRGLYHNKIKTPAKVIGRIALDLDRSGKYKQTRFNVNAYADSGVTTPIEVYELRKCDWTAAPANTYTIIQLDVVADDAGDYIVFIVGRLPNGLPFNLTPGEDHGQGGEVFWQWYKDPATNILYVRFWNGRADMEVRAWYG